MDGAKLDSEIKKARERLNKLQEKKRKTKGAKPKFSRLTKREIEGLKSFLASHGGKGKFEQIASKADSLRAKPKYVTVAVKEGKPHRFVSVVEQWGYNNRHAAMALLSDGRFVVSGTVKPEWAGEVDVFYNYLNNANLIEVNSGRGFAESYVLEAKKREPLPVWVANAVFEEKQYASSRSQADNPWDVLRRFVGKRFQSGVAKLQEIDRMLSSLARDENPLDVPLSEMYDEQDWQYASHTDLRQAVECFLGKVDLLTNEPPKAKAFQVSLKDILVQYLVEKNIKGNAR